MPVYRAFPVDEAGHVLGPPKEFKAKTDIEAITTAMHFVDGHAMEVWNTTRRVGLIQLRSGED